MLNRSFDKLGFILENLYISTNAVGLAIVDESGVIAAECGNLDIDVLSDYAVRMMSNGASLLASFSGSHREPFSVWVNGSKGNVALASVNKGFFLVIFYPKDVDIFNIKDNIGKFTADIRSVFVELEPYAKG